MTRYEEIKAKSFDEMALFIDSMLNGSVCPIEALKRWLKEDIGVPK